MTTAELVVITVATFFGPVFAVQAQKWIERLRENRARKETVFQTLMTTRSYRLSMDHVRSLNMIDIAFKVDREVIEAWRVYHDHLHSLALNTTPDVINAWETRSGDLLVALLGAMAANLDYEFDPVQLKRGSYAPRAHGQAQAENQALKQLFIQFFSQASAALSQSAAPPAPIAQQPARPASPSDAGTPS